MLVSPTISLAENEKQEVNCVEEDVSSPESSDKETMKNSILNFHKNTSKSWTRKMPFVPCRSPIFVLLISVFTFLILLTSYTKTYSISQNSSNSRISLCTIFEALTGGEKFLWYAPHSGFSNQLSEFKNAILLAGILNRTLIVPPVLDHHAVALGSCPKFRVLNPKDIRISVWDHAIELLKSGRYVSMADIVDISSLVPSSIQAIDFRIFASLWCIGEKGFTCMRDFYSQSSIFNSLRMCGRDLFGVNGNVDKCLYAVDEDCRTTVWTYNNGEEDVVLDSFQPDEQLKKRKNIQYSRTRRDVFKALGPGSESESATVLAFGSLFTAPYKGSELYIDIHEVQSDQRIQSLIEKSKFLPFVPEILSAGKKFALETIKASFLCAQLRLLDGQFKNHWKATFLGLKQKLESLEQTGPLPIHIFVMTDLPESKWTGTYLGDLAKNLDHFKLHFLREEDDLVVQTAKKLADAGHGLKLRSSHSINEVEGMNMHCSYQNQRLSDVLLYVEESICACASLGFVGTVGSTIAESIELMRNSSVCSKL